MPGRHEALDEICQATASALTSAYASGAISPLEVTSAVLSRADQVASQFNAFAVIGHGAALESARKSETRWRRGEPLSPVDGVPTTIKDIVMVRGYNVRYGSAVTSNVSDQPDAPAVHRLRKAGVVILGLTTTPEFGWKPVTDSPKFGVTRNPWNTSRTPGGSSGGAAVAAATGAGVFHLGTDGGGSIRIPASFSGVVGIKPSFGVVPAYPPSAFGTVAHIGPMARTPEDAVLMLNAMSGKDVRDWSQHPRASFPVFPKPIEWKGSRIGFWSKPCVGSNDPSVDDVVARTISDLEEAGARIDVVTLPMQDELLEIFCRHWHVGAANRLSSIDPADHHKLDPGFLKVAELGKRYSAVDRIQAEMARTRYGAQMDQLLETYDYLISPTVPIPAFEVGAEVPAGFAYRSWVEWVPYSYPINLSQQPACSVPCGFSAAGLPIGIQLISGRAEDEKLLSACLTYQRMYPDRFLVPGRRWPVISSGAMQ
jgi:aspartyl-tRNA(Asn)/glutamyl-tRNA(Gln) amidotransferase subunit A